MHFPALNPRVKDAGLPTEAAGDGEEVGDGEEAGEWKQGGEGSRSYERRIRHTLDN